MRLTRFFGRKGNGESVSGQKAIAALDMAKDLVEAAAGEKNPMAASTLVSNAQKACLAAMKAMTELKDGGA